MMFKILKRAARTELENIKNADSQFAWIVITVCVIGIIIWSFVKS